jgi:hypothetical protein
MNARTPFEGPRIAKPVAVAAEGLDYCYMLLSQIKDDPQLQDVQLWDFTAAPNGNFGRWLEVFTTLPGYGDMIRAIGVIQDAEESAEGTFRNTVQALTNVGLAHPTRTMEVTASKPAIGILVMPHSRPSGCLEHAVLEARQPDLPLHCAEQYLDCVGVGGGNDNWQAKVKVHALIASGDNPAWTLGQSVAGGMWDFTHPSLRVMIDFMRLLCGC